MSVDVHLIRRLFFLSVVAWSSIGNCGVQFDGLKSGDTVKSPLSVKMKVMGKTLRPAGEDSEDTKTGHHHIVIDGPAIPPGNVIPADSTHLHYGKAQDKAQVTLSPGPHSLTLQFADGAHRSYGPEWSQTIEINVH